MSEVSEERRLAAIMFTDIVSYTALAQQNEALALQLLEWHRELIRPIFKKHNGKEVKTIGDGFLVEFASALEAVKSAFEIQRALHEQVSQKTSGGRIQLRIGIHVGDVVHAEGDVYGDAVNVASRIEHLADPGGLCITRQVYDDVRNKLEIPVVSLGRRDLRNVELPIEIYKIILPWAPDPQQVAVPASTKRVAVLPLINISPLRADEYFADGLTEELIATLSVIPNLRVIARTSVAKYKNASKSVGEIGQELRVGVVLEGSVRKSENRIRATFELIDTESEEHLWTHSYDSDMKDIFEIQQHIAHRVAEALKVQLLAKDSDKLRTAARTSNSEAHAFYLKGRFHLNRGLEEGFGKANEYFQEAIKKDPNYALAYVGIAECEVESSFFDELAAKEAYPKAKENVKKALELDDSLAEAHACLARILFLFERNFTEAEREYQKALELNINLAEVHSGYSYFLLFTGRGNEASLEARHAIDLDPLSEDACNASGTVYLYLRDYDKAIQEYKSSLEIDPENALAHSNLGLAYANKGLISDAIASAEKAVALTAFGQDIAKTDLIYVYTKAGKKEEAEKILSEMKESLNSSHGSCVALARACSVLGRNDEAIGWLERAIEERSTYIISIGVDFSYDGMRSDPMFQEILGKIGLGKKHILGEEELK